MAYQPKAIEDERSLSAKLLDINWLFVLVISLVAGIGVAILYSVAGGNFEPWADRQAIRYSIGLGALFAIALTNLRVWIRLAYPMYIIALILLILVPVIGVENGGARRWLGFGALTFQPAEFMKIALVLALARYYQWLPDAKISNPLALAVPVIAIAVPVALVLKQPDLGTAILLAAVGVGIIFLAGTSWLYFIAGAGAVAAALPHVWSRLHDYQRERVLTFLEPERDPLGAGYHILQSKIALGSGGLSGKGFMRGTQSQLNFLPEKHTDFIFTMFAEEMGYVGGVALIGLFVIVMAILLFMMLRIKNTFGRLVAGGVAIGLFLYVFINIAMVMGLVPVVGVPLPLVSYGGTSMLTMMFGFGLAMSAYVHRRQSFGTDEFGPFL